MFPSMLLQNLEFQSNQEKAELSNSPSVFFSVRLTEHRDLAVLQVRGQYRELTNNEMLGPGLKKDISDKTKKSRNFVKVNSGVPILVPQGLFSMAILWFDYMRCLNRAKNTGQGVGAVQITGLKALALTPADLSSDSQYYIWSPKDHQRLLLSTTECDAILTPYKEHVGS